MLRTLQGTTLELVATGAPEALVADLWSFLDEIAAGGHLQAGAVFRYGPLLLRLSGRPGRLQVVAPAYEEDGSGAVEQDLGRQLTACGWQTTLCARLGAEPCWASLDAQLGVFGDPLAGAGAVYGHRLEAEAEVPGGSSGWLLACAAAPALLDGAVAALGAAYPQGIAPMRVGALLAACPALVPALALPAGWSAQIHAGRLIAVYDPDGHETLAASALARLIAPA